MFLIAIMPPVEIAMFLAAIMLPVWKRNVLGNNYATQCFQ